MYDETILRGRIASIDSPNWEPLERFLPIVLCEGFMWMHATALEDGTELQEYKHSLTRRYLALDGDADTWECLDRWGYRRMRHSDAIEQVFDPWWLLRHATADERRALDRALEAAWDCGNGDKAAGAHILPSSPACAPRRLPGRPQPAVERWSALRPEHSVGHAGQIEESAAISRDDHPSG